MSWLDSLYQRGAQAKRGGEPAPPTRQISPPAKLNVPAASPKPRKREPLRESWVQIHRPSEADNGMVAPVFYRVEDGVLTVHDADGKEIHAPHTLRPEDDALVLARIFTREHCLGDSGWFNRPLNYPRFGLA
jgi:hypothetical protein